MQTVQVPELHLVLACCSPLYRRAQTGREGSHTKSYLCCCEVSMLIEGERGVTRVAEVVACCSCLLYKYCVYGGGPFLMIT